MPYGYHWSPCKGTSSSGSGGRGRRNGALLGIAAVLIFTLFAAGPAVAAAAAVLEVIFITVASVVGAAVVAGVGVVAWRTRCYVLDRLAEREALRSRVSPPAVVPWFSPAAVPRRPPAAITARRPRVIEGSVAGKRTERR